MGGQRRSHGASSLVELNRPLVWGLYRPASGLSPAMIRDLASIRKCVLRRKRPVQKSARARSLRLTRGGIHNRRVIQLYLTAPSNWFDTFEREGVKGVPPLRNLGTAAAFEHHPARTDCELKRVAVVDHLVPALRAMNLDREVFENKVVIIDRVCHGRITKWDFMPSAPGGQRWTVSGGGTGHRVWLN